MFYDLKRYLLIKQSWVLENLIRILFRLFLEVGSDDSLHRQVSGEVPFSTEWNPADMADPEVSSSLANSTDEMSNGALKYLPGGPHGLKTSPLQSFSTSWMQ